MYRVKLLNDQHLLGHNTYQNHLRHISTIYSQSFDFVTTLPFHHGVELLQYFKYFKFSHDQVCLLFPIELVNGCDKVFVPAYWIHLHRSTYIIIHHLKLTFGIAPWLFAKISSMLLGLDTIFTYFRWYRYL